MSVLTFKTGDEPAIATEFGRLCTFRSDQTIGVPPRWQNISRLVTKSRFPSPWRTQARQRSHHSLATSFKRQSGTSPNPKQEKRNILHSPCDLRLRQASASRSVKVRSVKLVWRAPCAVRPPLSAVDHDTSKPRSCQSNCNQWNKAGMRFVTDDPVLTAGGRVIFRDSHFQHSPELSIKVRSVK